MEPYVSLLRSLLHLLEQNLFKLVPVLIALYVLWNKFQPGLVSIPGPTAAGYTKLWRVYSVFKGSAHLDAVELHKKHGNLVRIGPNVVSVADPKWIPVFYGSKEDYTKVRQAEFLVRDTD